MDVNTDMKASLYDLFPEHMPRMEAARTQSEFNVIHADLLNSLRKNLRETLSDANISTDCYSNLLDNSEEQQSLSAIEIDSTKYDSIINARGDKVREVVQSLYDGMNRCGQTDKNSSNIYMAAKLIINRFIATGDRGIIGANTKLLEYKKRNSNYFHEINEALYIELTDEEREQLDNSAAFAGATAAAVAGVSCCGGAAVVIAVVLIVVAILIPFLIFMLLEAACLIFVVNDISDNDKDYGKFKLVRDSAYNIHGKETAYTPELLSPVTIESEDREFVFLSGGFYATEKKSMALYGTNYGLKFKVSDTDISISFGVECPLNGNNKCYCGFNISAEDAANRVTDDMTHTASLNGYKATISMNSTSGRTAYYIARVYKE